MNKVHKINFYMLLNRGIFYLCEVIMNEKYMRLAIELAKKGKRKVKKNPLVGAVLVKDGKILGQGYHVAYGMEHAEENAIKNSLESVEGTELYVTLEPCCHFGKRPPCCNLLIDSKISKVYIGCLDPNPKVAGKGVKILENAGVSVQVGILEDECRKINASFFYHIRRKIPYVVLKSAMTLDGKIATPTGDSKWVTSEESRKKVHELRADLDGIMVGINTVIKDDPSLNVRLIEGDDPVRIVVDSKLRIPKEAKILHLESTAKTIIATTEGHDLEKYDYLSKLENVEIIITKSKDGRVDLLDLLQKLYEKDISSILLEGGGTLNYEMLSHNLVSKVMFFIAPKIIGGKNALTPVEGQGIQIMGHAIDIKNMNIQKIVSDFLLEGDVCLPE